LVNHLLENLNNRQLSTVLHGLNRSDSRQSTEELARMFASPNADHRRAAARLVEVVAAGGSAGGSALSRQLLNMLGNRDQRPAVQTILSRIAYGDELFGAANFSTLHGFHRGPGQEIIRMLNSTDPAEQRAANGFLRMYQ